MADKTLVSPVKESDGMASGRKRKRQSTNSNGPLSSEDRRLVFTGTEKGFYTYVSCCLRPFSIPSTSEKISPDVSDGFTRFDIPSTSGPTPLEIARSLEFFDKGCAEPRILCLGREDEYHMVQLYYTSRNTLYPLWQRPDRVRTAVPEHPTLLQVQYVWKNYPRNWYHMIAYKAPTVGVLGHLLHNLGSGLNSIARPKSHRFLPASFVYRMFRDIFSATMVGMKAGLVVGEEGRFDDLLLYRVKDLPNFSCCSEGVPRVVSGFTPAFDPEETAKLTDEERAEKILPAIRLLAQFILSKSQHEFQLFCCASSLADIDVTDDSHSIRIIYHSLGQGVHRAYALERGLDWPPYNTDLINLCETVADVSKPLSVAVSSILQMNDLLPAMKIWEENDLRDHPLDKDAWWQTAIEEMNGSTCGTFNRSTQEKDFKQLCRWAKGKDLVARWLSFWYDKVMDNEGGVSDPNLKPLQTNNTSIFETWNYDACGAIENSVPGKKYLQIGAAACDE